MFNRIFFGNQSEPEDQGGFCDRDSGIHYSNQSKREAADQAAVFEEHGGSSYFKRGKEVIEPSEADDDARFNTTILETDGLGFEYPSKHDPGR